MKNTKGFTLIELIVVLSVTTILLGIVISILLQSIHMYKIDETKSANQDSLNVASSSIETKIRSATNVSLSGADCVVTTASSTYTYSLNTTSHTLSINGSSLTDRISSFSCSVSGNVVTISISTITDNAGNYQSFDTSIILRKGD